METAAFFEHDDNLLASIAKAGDIDRLWARISLLMEAGFVALTKPQEVGLTKRHVGRGHTRIVTKPAQTVARAAVAGKPHVEPNSDGEAVLLLALHGRISSIAARSEHVRVRKCNAADSPTHSLLRSTRDMLLANGMQPIKDECNAWLASWDFVGKPQLYFVLRARVLAATALKWLKAAQRQTARKRLAASSQAYASDTKISKHWARLRPPMAAPLTHVVREKLGPAGQLVGSYATMPQEIDDIVREAWGKIYNAKSESKDQQDQRAQCFLDKYSKYITRRAAFALSPITAAGVQSACRLSSHTASGTDGWSPDDLSLMPPIAYHWLARLLNMVEFQKKWPSQLLHAKSSVFWRKSRARLRLH